MDLESLPARSEGSLLVVTDELAGRQWELTTLADAGRAHASAWVAPELVTFRRWLRALHARVPDALPVVSPAQRDALWRRVAAAEAERLGLVNSRGPARWAAQADALLAAWRIDADTLEAAPDSDFGVFLAWRRSYRAELAGAGWLDDTDLLARLEALPLGPHAHVEWLDRLDWTPAERTLARRLEASGRRVTERPAPAGRGAAHRIGLADPAAELRTAAHWAAAHGAARGARIALVVPDLGRREHDVARALEDALGASAPVWIDGGRALEHEPVVGAAVQGIELLTARGGFAQLSYWLRSPFFQGREPAAAALAARAEAALRASVASQLGIADAYRDAGLVERLDALAPGLGARLRRALEDAGPTGLARTPTQWLAIWQRALASLGWPARDTPRDAPVWQSWESALGELAELTPMLGRVDAADALAELRAILARRRVEGPLPAAGVHVLARPEAVGPGYDAVWVTGLTDRRWPEPPELNPLLPRRLQVAHAMPGATPASAWQRSAARTAALVVRVDAAVFSWPEHVDEQPAEPSSLLAAFPEADTAALGVDAGLASASARFEPRALERPADPVPAFAGGRIHGGARTLDLQSRAPLVAFCASRLAARPLERVARGVPPRVLGIAVHEALHALGRDLPAQAQWCARTGPELGEAVEHALAQAFEGARRSLAALFELERERVRTMLARLLERESERAPFAIAAVEQRRYVTVRDCAVACRIDRIDRLADGTLAVLDYKTGRSAPAWLDARLGDTQLPLYALDQTDPVGATAIVSLHRGNVSYAGFWRVDDAFPGRAARLLDEHAWRAQIAQWRTQIETLVAEYAAGDVRLFDAALDAARGDYAPLTRVAEHAAGLDGFAP